MIDCREQFLEEHYKFNLCFFISCVGFYFFCYYVCWHPVMYVINIYQNSVYIENGKQGIFARKFFGAYF